MQGDMSVAVSQCKAGNFTERLVFNASGSVFFSATNIFNIYFSYFSIIVSFPVNPLSTGCFYCL